MDISIKDIIENYNYLKEQDILNSSKLEKISLKSMIFYLQILIV